MSNPDRNHPKIGYGRSSFPDRFGPMRVPHLQCPDINSVVWNFSWARISKFQSYLVHTFVNLPLLFWADSDVIFFESFFSVTEATTWTSSFSNERIPHNSFLSILIISRNQEPWFQGAVYRTLAAWYNTTSGTSTWRERIHSRMEAPLYRKWGDK